MPALPYSKKRYYLSGIDWIIGVLNSYMSSNTVTGNHSTLIIELKNSVKENELKARIDSIYRSMPILSGRLSRDWFNLAPYWKVPSGTLKNYDFDYINLEKHHDIDSELTKVLNRPFSSAYTYLSFFLLNGNDTIFLLMTFDHRILDACGAELFLNLLAEFSEDKLASTLSKIKTTDSPHLKDWGEKFTAGRNVQRKIIEFSKEGCFSPSKYNMKNLPVTKDINLVPVFRHFSIKESKKIVKDAEKKAGFMMETPYLLAVTAKTLYDVANQGEAVKYFVPVPIDLRIKGEESKKIFFNQLSFLFFFFEINQETTLDQLICEIRKQFYTQIEEGFPEEMQKAAYPGRIFPLWFLKKVMKFPFDGKNCSFVFSNVGNCSFQNDNILGKKVKNIYHMPRIPTPPGIGIFFNRLNDSMNLTVITDKNALDNEFNQILNQKIVDFLLDA